MKKYHIPYDLVLQDGENDLHEKVNKDSNFCRYLHEMNTLIDENIKDPVLKSQISEACRMVYIFAEIAGHKEGFKSGVGFLTSVLGSAGEYENFSDKSNNG